MKRRYLVTFYDNSGSVTRKDRFEIQTYARMWLSIMGYHLGRSGKYFSPEGYATLEFSPR